MNTVVDTEPTVRKTLILPEAVVRQFEAEQLRRRQANLPYVSDEELMSLFFVDCAARRHPIPNPYGPQVAS